MESIRDERDIHGKQMWWTKLGGIVRIKSSQGKFRKQNKKETDWQTHFGKKTMGNKTNQRVEEEADLFACFLCVCEIA